DSARVNSAAVSASRAFGSGVGVAGGVGNTFVGSITALAGGGLSASTPLLSGRYNVVTVAASANDSVVLPVIAGPGHVCTVRNSGASTIAVFAQSGSTVAPAASATQAASATIATMVSSTYVA